MLVWDIPTKNEIFLMLNKQAFLRFAEEGKMYNKTETSTKKIVKKTNIFVEVNIEVLVWVDPAEPVEPR